MLCETEKTYGWCPVPGNLRFHAESSVVLENGPGSAWFPECKQNDARNKYGVRVIRRIDRDGRGGREGTVAKRTKSSCHTDGGVGEAADADGDSPEISLKYLAVSCDHQCK